MVSLNVIISLVKSNIAAFSGYSISVIAVAESPSCVVQQKHCPMFSSRVTLALKPGSILLAMVLELKPIISLAVPR